MGGGRPGRETEELKTVSAGEKKNVTSIIEMVRRCASEIELKQRSSMRLVGGGVGGGQSETL